MGKIQVDAKMRMKRSTIPATVPTVGGTDDHTDGSWNDTDIYPGEFFLNVPDERLWIGVDGGVKELVFAGSGDTWQMTGVAFVDPVSGTAGGVVGDGNKPFQTLAQAQAASNQIICKPGIYSGSNTILSSKKIDFMYGAIGDGSFVLIDNGATIDSEISGQLIFGANSDGIVLTGANSELNASVLSYDNCTAVAGAVEAGQKLHVHCRSITCNNQSGSAVAIDAREGAEVFIVVEEFAYFQHWAMSNGGVTNNRSKVTFICPDIQMFDYTANYGAIARSLINCQGLAPCDYLVVGNFKNLYPTQTTSFGASDGIVLYVNSTDPLKASNIKLVGSFDSGALFGFRIHYNVRFGRIDVKGTVKSNSRAIALPHLVTAAASEFEFHAKDTKIESFDPNEIGHGKKVFLENCSEYVSNPAAITNWEYNASNPAGGTPELKVYNSIAELENNGGGTYIDNVAVDFKSVNSKTSEPLAGGLVDGWAGHTRVTGLIVPKI